MTKVAVGWACAALLGGCLPGADEDVRCSGYLGCSAGQTIGGDAGSSSADVTEGLPATGVNAIAMGLGCGKPLPSDQPATVAGTPTGYKQYTVMGTGASLAGPQPQDIGPRTFWVRVPADYDPNHAYCVVYIGQGCVTRRRSRALRGEPSAPTIGHGGSRSTSDQDRDLWANDGGGTPRTLARRHGVGLG